MRLIDADALADALFEKRKNYPQWVADTIGGMPTIDVDVLLKEQEATMQCIKEKCRICPHCANCDVDENGLLKEQEAFKPLAKENDSYECICGAIVGFDELDAGVVVQIRFDYCPFCGKHISWEGGE